FNPTANNLVKRVGLSLPMLTGTADDAQAQAQPQAQAGGQQQGAQGQGGGQRQGQGQGGGGRQGGGAFGANRVAVVVTQPVKTGLINNQLTSIGDSSAIHSVTVNFPATGTLMSVNVKPGDVVQVGTVLATLDNGTQQIAYDKAQLASQD